MIGMPEDNNRKIYEDPAVVRHYFDNTTLQKCEETIFTTYVPLRSRILDIGVGAGRTTPILSARAQFYFGADYSSAMVEACRRKFPRLEFQVLDAGELSSVASGSFDVVVFSFNGLDELHPIEKRHNFFAESHRILKKGGVLIYSSHNSSRLAVAPLYAGATPLQAAWRTLRALFKSFSTAYRALFGRAYWQREGYIFDPVHGGLHIYSTNPEAAAVDAARHGFGILALFSSRHPNSLPRFLEPWYYYVLRKEGDAPTYGQAAI